MHRTQPRALSVLTAFVALVLAGTLLAPTGAVAEDGAPRAAAGARQAPPLDYVAMGDSYSAASGVLPIALDAPLNCLRSARNFPAVIAERLGADLTDVTCGGAESKHFFTKFYRNTPPQLKALSRRTDLVTMTIGGNDNGVFIGAITRCLIAGVTALGQGSPCKDQHQKKFFTDVRKKTYPALVKAFRAVRRQAPNADVAVLGYPWITPPRGGCLSMPIARGDIPFLHALQALLNRKIKQAATGADLTFVDFDKVSKGHDACQPIGKRWIEPVLLTEHPVVVHPNALGSRKMARHAMKVMRLR